MGPRPGVSPAGAVVEAVAAVEEAAAATAASYAHPPPEPAGRVRQTDALCPLRCGPAGGAGSGCSAGVEAVLLRQRGRPARRNRAAQPVADRQVVEQAQVAQHLRCIAFGDSAD